jgi:hypothetical protein
MISHETVRHSSLLKTLTSRLVPGCTKQGNSTPGYNQKTNMDSKSSHKGSSRHAVEEPTGRGDMQKCSVILHSKKLLYVLKMTRTTITMLLVAFICHVAHAAQVDGWQPNPNVLNDEWMSHPNVQRKTILELTFPVSHDSCTHELTYHGGKCQELSIYDQLNAGVRALDIRARLSYFKRTLYLHHGMVDCQSAFVAAKEEDFTTKVLADVMTFLQQHPNEIVFLRCKAFKKKRRIVTEVRQKIEAYVDSAIAQTPVQRITMSNAKARTVQNLVQAGERLVLMFEGDYDYETTKTSDKTASKDSGVLVRKIKALVAERHAISKNLRPAEAADQSPCWLSAQVTNWKRATWITSGYQSIATESAHQLATSWCVVDITKATRGQTSIKLFTFVGMDFVGTEDPIKRFVECIILANQLPRRIQTIVPRCVKCPHTGKCDSCNGTGILRPTLGATQDASERPSTDIELEDDSNSQCDDNTGANEFNSPPVTRRDFDCGANPTGLSHKFRSKEGSDDDTKSNGSGDGTAAEEQNSRPDSFSDGEMPLPKDFNDIRRRLLRSENGFY